MENPITPATSRKTAVDTPITESHEDSIVFDLDELNKLIDNQREQKEGKFDR
jgi:hypothetical protein